MAVKLSVIYQGFEMIDDVTIVYFDTEKQGIKCHYPKEITGIDEEEDEFLDDKYIAFPSQYEINEYKWMEDFAVSYPDKKISIALQIAIIGNGAFQRFKLAIQAYEITQEWYAYKKDRRVKLAIEWCEAHQIEYENDIA